MQADVTGGGAQSAVPSRPTSASIVDQLVAVSEATTDLVAVTDTTFRPTYVNPAGRSFFGLDAETPAGTLDLTTGIDPQLRDTLQQQVRSALAHSGTWRTEYTLTAPHTGQQRRVVAMYHALVSPSGAPLGFAVIARGVNGEHDEPVPTLEFVPHQALIERTRLEDELTRAIESRQLELFFQPVVDTTSGLTRGHEALLRWHHPERGVLLPCEFLPAVDSAGLSEVFGAWTIEESARAVAAFERAGTPTAIGVNLFSTQLVTPQLANTMHRAADAAGVDVGLLAIEVSETTLMSDVRNAGPVFEELREQGITVAVDDFGTGYSNLVRLRELDIDFLKIDRSLVVGIDHDPRARQLFEAVMSMAAAVDAHVLAEGVETAAQVDVLKAMGCRFAQGHHTGRPAALAAALARLS